MALIPTVIMHLVNYKIMMIKIHKDRTIFNASDYYTGVINDPRYLTTVVYRKDTISPALTLCYD